MRSVQRVFKAYRKKVGKVVTKVKTTVIKGGNWKLKMSAAKILLMNPNCAGKLHVNLH